MIKPFFHSFYSDPSLATIKHALLYYGEIVIPTDDFMIFFGENHNQARHISLVEENMWNDLRFLEDAGVVEFVTASQDQELNVFHDAIVQQQNIEAIQRSYSIKEFQPIFKQLSLDTNNPEHLEIANSATVQLAATCLSSIVKKGYLPCVDNIIVSDTIGIGLRAVVDQSFTELDSTQINQLKKRVVANQVYRLALPAFQFRSFHDVLELRERLLTRLIALDDSISNIAMEVKGHPWDSDFESQVKHVIKKQVIPVIEALKKDSKFKISNVATQMAGAATLVTLQSVLPETLAQWLIGAGAVSVKDAIQKEHDRVKSSLVDNSFGVLLEIGKELK